MVDEKKRSSLKKIGLLTTGLVLTPWGIKANELSLDQTCTPETDSAILVKNVLPETTWTNYVPSSHYINSKTNRSHRFQQEKDYLTFITPNEHPFLDLGDQFKDAFHSKEERARAILDFIHREHTYTNVGDIENASNVKYPIETLVERGGQCEDLSLLGATLMKAADIDVALLVLKNTPHVALGIEGNFTGMYWTESGKRFYYAETAGIGHHEKAPWDIGTIPNDFNNNPRANVYVVE